ncbi:hypothetical protein E2C01_060750 [Portunus trituberculatus]|uniref:Uncharacterized protein n=1 Tax=Portunus trituberculatus TaxID=210409 RepID=A0A5B7H3E8_PORTR|nr:hypothetical protein [Portunus trituberculatus]
MVFVLITVDEVLLRLGRRDAPRHHQQTPVCAPSRPAHLRVPESAVASLSVMPKVPECHVPSTYSLLRGRSVTRPVVASRREFV